VAKFNIQLNQFKSAVAKLEEALKQPYNDFIRDSAIQRFEFSIDLAWKTVKSYLQEYKGLICNSPVDCLKEAYTQDILEYDEYWIELVKLRNLTSHTYNQELADEIFKELPKAMKNFSDLLEQLEVMSVRD
jgi:nucleotidyltransferase substrate binding protein (TIGR01987 family)